MTDLLKKIKEEHRDFAKVLQEADICTDSDIRSLTGAELHQLLPEKKDLKLRRTIFDIIYKQKSVVQLLREMKDISGDFKDGVLVNNLPILKEMQSFLDDRISSLEANIQNQPNQESVTNVTNPRDDCSPKGAHGEVMSDLLEKIKEEHQQDVAKVLQEADLCSDSDIRSLTQEELNQLFPGPKNLKLRRRIFEIIQNQKPVKQPPPTVVNISIPSKAKLVYQMVVTGTTFDAHVQLMENVKMEVKDQFDLVQSNSNDYDVTIVFCPIVSRMGPDVESAMRDVKVSSSGKPVILVLMHHAYEAKFMPNVQQGANVHLQVNVFFHETKHGLLNCGENGAVVCEITKYLKEIPITNSQVVDAEMADLEGDWVCVSWTPQTPSPPPSNQKPVEPLPPTGVNNGIPSKEERSKVVNTRKAKLVYQMVVTGTTFGAHDQLTEKVKNEVMDQFDLVQSNSNDYDVTIVFCPIVSRMGPDVESALRDVKVSSSDKPVILVLMHHAYETKFIPNVQQGANVHLQVNDFFHETKHGLLHCGENGAVVCEITKYLKEIPIPNSQVADLRGGNL